MSDKSEATPAAYRISKWAMDQARAVHSEQSILLMATRCGYLEGALHTMSAYQLTPQDFVEQHLEAEE